MTGYDLTRRFYNFKFKNPGVVRSSHSDMYFYVVDLWNRLGQIEKIGLPTAVTMQCLNIGSFNTYKKTLQDLIDFGFITLLSDSKNQYQSKVIALSNFDEALDEALDKATIKALDKATDKATDEATDEATDSIYKQINNITTKQLNKEQITIILSYFDNLSQQELNDELKKIKEKSCVKKEKSCVKKEKIDFEKILEIFSSVCVDLPKPKKITPARKTAIKNRIKENSLEDLGRVFTLVHESDFLSGRKTDFKASLDWILNPTNFLKILEGNYKNLEKNGTEKSNIQIFTEAVQSDAAKFNYFDPKPFKRNY